MSCESFLPADLICRPKPVAQLSVLVDFEKMVLYAQLRLTDPVHPDMLHAS